METLLIALYSFCVGYQFCALIYEGEVGLFKGYTYSQIFIRNLIMLILSPVSFIWEMKDLIYRKYFMR